jgi:ubiquitin-conjugating enzyme E2 G2
MALKRLTNEYRTITNDSLEGIVAGPKDEEDMFLWHVTFLGPPDTPWEDGIYEAELKFPPDYPHQPPVMRFIDPIPHPNGTVTPSLTKARGND